MAKIMFLLAFLLSFYSTSQASDCPSEQIIVKRDFKGLNSYITQNSFPSLECVISALPEDIRGVRTYVKNSLALQEASALYPRAILVSKNGGMALTFNGDPSQKGYNEIEFLALDDDSKPSEWIAGSIKIKQGRAQIELKKNKCASCHGDPIRPIWGKYPDWPGFYGSVDDFLPDPQDPGKGSLFFEEDKKGSDAYSGENDEPRLSAEKLREAHRQRQQFIKHRQMAKNHPRYKHLEAASDHSNPVYPFTEIYRERNLVHRPNLNIGGMLNTRQAEILWSRIKKSPFLKAYPNSVSYSNVCYAPKANKNEEAKDPHIEKIFEHFSGVFKKSLGEPPRVPPDENPYDLLWYRELMGLYPNEATLLLADRLSYLDKDLINYGSGYRAGFFDALSSFVNEFIHSWDGEGKFTAISQGQLLDPSTLTPDDPSYNPKMSYIKGKYLGHPTYVFLNRSNSKVFLTAGNHEFSSEESKKNHKGLCELLEIVSNEELSRPVEKFATQTKIRRPKFQGPWPEALNSCIECHDSTPAIASRIPFRDPEKLKNFKPDFVHVSGALTLEDMTEILTHPKYPGPERGHLRMPLGRAPLTEIQRQQVIQWVESAR